MKTIAAACLLALAAPAGAHAFSFCDVPMRHAAQAAQYRDFGVSIAPLIQDDQAGIRMPDAPGLSKAYGDRITRMLKYDILTMRWVYAHPTISAADAAGVGERECNRSLAGEPWG